MTTKQQDDVIYSKVNIQQIREHQSMFGIPDSKCKMQLMTDSEYQAMVKREAFFFVDHNGFLRHQFSGEVLASSREQIDILIGQLEGLRATLHPALDCTRE